MKNFFVFVLIVCLIVCSLAACDLKFGDGEGQVSENTVETTSETEAIDYSNISDKFLDLNSHFTISNSYYTSHPLRFRDICGMLDEQNRPIIYVKSWDEYFEIPIAYEFKSDYHYFISEVEICATLTSKDTGVLICEPYLTNDKFEIIKFTKGSDEYSVTTLNIQKSPYHLGFSNLYCNFIDDKIGFLFAIEILHPENGYFREQPCIYKTTDGGESWSLIECNDPIMFSIDDFPIYAEFFNEDIGVISGRLEIITDLECRSFVTYDGGKTWESFPHLPCPENTNAVEIMDIGYSDGKYTMYTVMSIRNDDGNDFFHKIGFFTSTDMRSWTYERME